IEAQTHARDVEPHRDRRDPRLLQEGLAHGAELATLPRIDGVEPCCESSSPPGLDLADHEDPATLQDEIQLSDATAPVARDDPEPLPNVERLRRRLTGTTRIRPCVHRRTIATSTDTAAGPSVLRRIEDGGGVLAPQLFHVDVPSRHHADGGNESCGPEHVPDPGVGELNLDPSTLESLDVHR